MDIKEFETELKTLNSDLAVRINNPPERVTKMFPDVVKLASITFRGTEICTVPAEGIYDEPNGSYGVDLRNDGRFVRHRTRPEALAIVKDTLSRLEHDKEFYNDFFGLGASSDEELRKPSEPVQELVEEVPVELQEVKVETPVLPDGEKKELQ